MLTLVTQHTLLFAEICCPFRVPYRDLNTVRKGHYFRTTKIGISGNPVIWISQCTHSKFKR